MYIFYFFIFLYFTEESSGGNFGSYFGRHMYIFVSFFDTSLRSLPVGNLGRLPQGKLTAPEMCCLDD